MVRRQQGRVFLTTEVTLNVPQEGLSRRDT